MCPYIFWKENRGVGESKEAPALQGAGISAPEPPVLMVQEAPLNCWKDFNWVPRPIHWPLQVSEQAQASAQSFPESASLEEPTAVSQNQSSTADEVYNWSLLSKHSRSFCIWDSDEEKVNML